MHALALVHTHTHTHTLARALTQSSVPGGAPRGHKYIEIRSTKFRRRKRRRRRMRRMRRRRRIRRRRLWSRRRRKKSSRRRRRRRHYSVARPGLESYKNRTRCISRNPCQANSSTTTRISEVLSYQSKLINTQAKLQLKFSFFKVLVGPSVSRQRRYLIFSGRNVYSMDVSASPYEPKKPSRKDQARISQWRGSLSENNGSSPAPPRKPKNSQHY